MSNSSRQSEALNPEAISTGDLTTIVGWLRRLPKEEIGELSEALARHDSAKLAGFVGRFRNWLKNST
jgi:cell division inhibitor SulA